MTKKACSAFTLHNLYAKDHRRNEADGGRWGQTGACGRKEVDRRMDGASTLGRRANGGKQWTDRRTSRRVLTSCADKQTSGYGWAYWTDGSGRGGGRANKRTSGWGQTVSNGSSKG